MFSWPNVERSEGVPVYWFHVASGEFEYAKPVIRELKKTSDCRIVVTYFSPSVKKSIEENKAVDYSLPSPWDTPWHWRKFLKTFRPGVLAIARTDLWPNMIWEAKKSGLRSVLFSATLPSHSARVASFWGRLFYSFLIDDLDEVSCVSTEDADNFLRISPQAHVTIDGDSRFDQVEFRLTEAKASPPPALEVIRSQFLVEKNPHTFVAGSTWPEDEEILVPALAEFFKLPHSVHSRIIIAPHEVDPSHIESLKNLLARFYIPTEILSLLQNPRKEPYVTPKILILDQVGILAPLYDFASLAFVGGSFKKSVHSVMEPAAAGCLTLVGPFHQNNREALLLKSQGFVKEIETIKGLVNELKIWATKTDPAISIQKNSIKEFVKSQQGTSKIIAAKIHGN